MRIVKKMEWHCIIEEGNLYFMIRIYTNATSKGLNRQIVTSVLHERRWGQDKLASCFVIELELLHNVLCLKGTRGHWSLAEQSFWIHSLHTTLRSSCSSPSSAQLVQASPMSGKSSSFPSKICWARLMALESRKLPTESCQARPGSTLMAFGIRSSQDTKHQPNNTNKNSNQCKIYRTLS